MFLCPILLSNFLQATAHPELSPMIIDSRSVGSAMAIKSLQGCDSCFWLFRCCIPLLCTFLWFLNALFVVVLLRWFVSLWFPEAPKPSTTQVRPTPRVSHEGTSSDERTALLTPIPLIPFFGGDNV